MVNEYGWIKMNNNKDMINVPTELLEELTAKYCVAENRYSSFTPCLFCGIFGIIDNEGFSTWKHLPTCPYLRLKTLLEGDK